MGNRFENILVTGGGGYVGAILVPKLLKEGYNVSVLDLFIYGEEVLDIHPNLNIIKGDLRDKEITQCALENIDAVIHLACISNDPSFELNPNLGKSINYDAFVQLYDESVKNNIKRFIYASSSSVYGIKEEENVTEDLQLLPLTDYSKYKALCEEYLLDNLNDNMTSLILRPATVCGYSPRQRLDLTVNILTNHAINNNRIKVFGGSQKRPNIHIEDITDLYIKSLEYTHDEIHGKIFNAGYENHKVKEIALMVKKIIANGKEVKEVEIITEPTDDNRSYHISSEKIKKELGYEPKYTIEDAIKDLTNAFNNDLLPNSMTDSKYFNVKKMKELKLE